MADRVSIAIRQEQALTRLLKAAGRLAEKLDVAAPDIPTNVRVAGGSPELLRAMQFEALSVWVGEVVNSVDMAQVEVELDGETAPESNMPMSAYDDLSKADLVLEIRQRGMDVGAVAGSGANGNILKSDLVAALLAHDGEDG